MDPSFIPYRLAAAYLQQQLQRHDVPSPVIGIICGSGLSGLSATLQHTLTVPYRDIPGFPSSTGVPGHKGEVVFGVMTGEGDDSNGNTSVPVMCFRGRFHSYEGHDMKTVVLPVYVMRCLGSVRVCIVTNAAGGLNPDYSNGDVLCVSDHLALPQLAGKNPLIGPNDDELGPRFPPTSNAYPETLRNVAMQAAKELNMSFVRGHGTYCFVSGPMYESKAECRFLRSLGGDAVGMSTIPEVVAAHHCELQVLCLSLITNPVVMDGDTGQAVVSHEEVLESAEKRATQMQDLIRGIVLLLHDQQVLHEMPPLPHVSLLVPDVDKARHEGLWQEQQNQTKGQRAVDAHKLILQTVIATTAVFVLGAFAGMKLRK